MTGKLLVWEEEKKREGENGCRREGREVREGGKNLMQERVFQVLLLLV